MATSLTIEEMKAFVRRHFEDFVNAERAEVQGSCLPAHCDQWHRHRLELDAWSRSL